MRRFWARTHPSTCLPSHNVFALRRLACGAHVTRIDANDIPFEHQPLHSRTSAG